MDQSGVLPGGLPYFAIGSGRPLVVFQAFTAAHANPAGVARWAALRMLRPLSRDRRVYLINRRPSLPPATTMADLAGHYAEAIGGAFDEPVDVLGISTGGSVALQFAVDHGHLLRRLVVAGAAHRLGPAGKAAQLDWAWRAGNGRHPSPAVAPLVTESPVLQRLFAAMMWLSDLPARGTDYTNAIRTVEAEDAFDLRDRLSEIKAPTLIVCGDHDLNYPMDLLRETARLIPSARLTVYPARGHVGTFADRRFAPDVRDFLD